MREAFREQRDCQNALLEEEMDLDDDNEKGIEDEALLEAAAPPDSYPGKA